MADANIANWTVADYDEAAEAYFASLPLEHFMESTPHAMQRKITWDSLALVRKHLPQLQIFNELLVQYPINAHLGQVVPDNMVIVSEEPSAARGSYNLPFEVAPPFWMLEYVSASSRNKDYVSNLQKYDRELQVPYYLLFDPETKDLRLYRHSGQGYQQVPANEAGRFPVVELDLEVGLHNDWARFWYRGELIPLPEDLLERNELLNDRLDEAEYRVETELQRAEKERLRATEQARLAEQERLRAEEQARLAEQERLRAEQERSRAAEEQHRAEAAEAELVRLKAQLAQLLGQGGGESKA